jgi:hypothetical protein
MRAATSHLSVSIRASTLQSNLYDQACSCICTDTESAIVALAFAPSCSIISLTKPKCRSAPSTPSSRMLESREGCYADIPSDVGEKTDWRGNIQKATRDAQVIINNAWSRLCCATILLKSCFPWIISCLCVSLYMMLHVFPIQQNVIRRAFM